MPKIPFAVSARTARLIGRENVSNAEGAIIELVKNCYDADAKTAIVLVDKPNDTILILDNGEGMTDEIITEKWMTIGTDNKLNEAVSTDGRVKAGAKGIGRFALDRLGEKCTMITFPAHNTIGYRWEVDWSQFEKKNKGTNVKINEVYAELNELQKTTYKRELLREIPNTKISSLLTNEIFKTGTLLKITELRDEWRDESINKIYENLELLMPPSGAPRINIFLLSGEEPRKYGRIPNTDFSDYDYKVVATYKKNPSHIINFKIHRNEFDFGLVDKQLFDFPDMKVFPFDKKTFKKEHFVLNRSFTEIMKGFKDHRGIADTIGDFEFTFYFLKNTFTQEDREKFLYKDFSKDRGEWLKRFGGIKLYRDNFRVRPYGEINTPTYDWLMLGERFGQNPAGLARKGSRIRPNQVAGIVKFSRIENPYLEDKSSREGLQENDTYELFKNVLIGIIKVQEDDRSTIGYNLNELYNLLHPEDQAIEESTEIAEEEEEGETSEQTIKKSRTLKKGFKASQKRLRQKDEELAISRAMASAGIMIASFSHEFHGIKNDLSSRTNNLKKFLTDVVDPKKLRSVPDRKNPLSIIDDFKKQDDRIRQWIEFSVELTKKDRRKVKSLDLKTYFKNFSPIWPKLLEQREILLSFHFDKRVEYLIKVSELDLDTIFDNLITNSVEAFDRPGFVGQKKISIEMENRQSRVFIKYSDTGPGIPIEYKNINDIFAPFETSKKDDLGNDIGTGLGMWLVKSSIDSNRGKVELVRPKKGFELRIHFKTVKR